MKKRFTRNIIPLAFLLLGIGAVQAQTVDDRKAVKEWLVANKAEVVLVTNAELKQLSPTAREMLLGNPKVLVYEKEVTVGNIESYQLRNNKVSLKPLQTKEMVATQKLAIEAEKKASTVVLSESERVQVKNWVEGPGKSVKIISKNKFAALPMDKKTELQAEGVLIYSKSELTWEDIQRYQSTN